MPSNRLETLLMYCRKPKAAFYFVVLCLFAVALNWAVRKASWQPVAADTAANTNLTATPSLSASAWDYFHPAWTAPTQETWLNPFSRKAPEAWSLTENSLRRFLSDPDRHLSPEFQVPQELRERVLFWMRVHSQYTSSMRVFHDRNNPSIVYGYADFTPVFLAAESKAQALTQASRLETQIIKELKGRIKEAGSPSVTQKLTPKEKQELNAFLVQSGIADATTADSRIESIRSQTGQRDEFLLALERSKDLLPTIENSLKSFDLPVELARIPFVESSFNSRALSKVGACGIWQLMPETAKQFIGASRESVWADPLIQTRAAARMLIIFRSLLPDWSTTVTAYNSGVGRLQRLTLKYHTNSIGKILEAEDTGGLGFAGKNFYAQFLSANLVEAYKKEIFPLQKTNEASSELAFQRPAQFFVAPRSSR